MKWYCGKGRFLLLSAMPFRDLTSVGKYAVSYEYQPTDPLSLRERAGVRVKCLPLSAFRGREFLTNYPRKIAKPTIMMARIRTLAVTNNAIFRVVLYSGVVVISPPPIG